MAEKITKWVSECGGGLFDTEEAADRYDAKQRLVALLEDDYFKTHPSGFCPTSVAAYFLDNAPAIIEELLPFTDIETVE